jgi:hypothetical protein
MFCFIFTVMSFLDDSSEGSNMVVRVGAILLLGVILLSGFSQSHFLPAKKA